MENQLTKLRNRVFGKKNQETDLTRILMVAREFGCLGDILGRDYEIKDSKGKLKFIVRQKPIAIKQLNTLLKEFVTIKKADDEKESAKFGGKGKGNKLRKK